MKLDFEPTGAEARERRDGTEAYWLTGRIGDRKVSFEVSKEEWDEAVCGLMEKAQRRAALSEVES